MRISVFVACVVVLAGCSNKPPAGANEDGGESLPSCEAPTVLCSASCANLNTDNDHCGSCDVACEAGKACAGGQCYARDCNGIVCGEKQACVSGTCVDRACFGVVCPGGQLCANGACLNSACSNSSCGLNQVCVNEVCTDAACVGVACPAGAFCSQGLCHFDTCSDGTKDGAETDWDCGGDCPACAGGRVCGINTDCESHACETGICKPATCSDGIKNQGEGDTDCGGPCPLCATGKTCNVGTQCATSACAGGHCVEPTCTDGAKNGAESDVDCGGTCGPCAQGSVCRTASDCDSAICISTKCVPQTCQNAAKDGTETDVDCGGQCAPCAPSKACSVSADCSSKVCSGSTKTCAAPLCSDLIKNGTEGDVDCGGSCAVRCAVGKTCNLDTDCVTRKCNGGTCAQAACNDNALNGSETDVDCGGNACGKCDQGKFCLLGSDCKSLVCSGGTCAAPNDFGPPTAFPMTAAGGGIAAADLDGDGVLDIVVTNPSTQTTTLFYGTGNGGFDAGVGPSTNGVDCYKGSASVVIADFNMDGIQDLMLPQNHPVNCAFTSGLADCRMTFVPGLGSRTWGASTSTDVLNQGNCGDSARLATLNSDGYPDLLVGGGPGVFGGPASKTFAVMGGPNGVSSMTSIDGGSQIEVGDLNNDSLPDFVGKDTSANILVMLGGGGANFQPRQYFGVGTGTGGVDLADFDGDQILDLVYTSNSSAQVGVAKGTGLGTFNSPSVYTVSNANQVRVADLDGNGKIDLVIGANGIWVLRGNGDGSFQTPRQYAASLGAVGNMVLRDFNADGKMDLAVVVGSNLEIMLNTNP